MTTNELTIKYLEATKAKTKFDMCYWMDRFHWKNIPWVNLMLSVYTKIELKAEYELFLSSFNL